MRKHFSVFDHLPIGVAITDVHFRVLFWNTSLELWTGWGRHEIIGESLLDRFPHLRETSYQARLDLLLETRSPLIFSHQLHGAFFPHRNPEENQRIQHVTVAFYSPAPDETSLIFSVEDRTELSLRIQTARIKERDLQQALKEKDFLMRELNHRVKNNLNMILSFIELQRGTTDDPVFLHGLDDLDGRIRSFSALHEALYRSDRADRIPLDQYLRSVTEDLFATMRRPHCKSELRYELESIAVRSKEALYLGLITVEALTNAVKYGIGKRDQGVVTIRCGHTEGERGKRGLILSIADDGPGFPESRSPHTADSLGLRLIETLAEELGAQLRRYNNPGAVISLTFSSDIEWTEAVPPRETLPHPAPRG